MVRFQDKDMIVVIPRGDKDTLRNYVNSLLQVMKMKDPDNGNTSDVDFWVLDLIQNLTDLDCEDNIYSRM